MNTILEEVDYDYTVYSQGKEAFKEGKMFLQNPYKSDPNAYHFWGEGFLDSREGAK